MSQDGPLQGTPMMPLSLFERCVIVLEQRFRECHLELHPEKSKMVCCKSDVHWVDSPVNTFEFLGYEFRLRTAVNRQGRTFLPFMPATSPSSAKAVWKEIRSWRI
jgi:RNA-directed DNA polymerase